MSATISLPKFSIKNIFLKHKYQNNGIEEALNEPSQRQLQQQRPLLKERVQLIRILPQIDRQNTDTVVLEPQQQQRVSPETQSNLKEALKDWLIGKEDLTIEHILKGKSENNNVKNEFSGKSISSKRRYLRSKRQTEEEEYEIQSSQVSNKLHTTEGNGGSVQFIKVPEVSNNITKSLSLQEIKESRILTFQRSKERRTSIEIQDDSPKHSSTPQNKNQIRQIYFQNNIQQNGLIGNNLNSNNNYIKSPIMFMSKQSQLPLSSKQFTSVSHIPDILDSSNLNESSSKFNIEINMNTPNKRKTNRLVMDSIKNDIFSPQLNMDNHYHLQSYGSLQHIPLPKNDNNFLNNTFQRNDNESKNPKSYVQDSSFSKNDINQFLNAIKMQDNDPFKPTKVQSAQFIKLPSILTEQETKYEPNQTPSRQGNHKSGAKSLGVLPQFISPKSILKFKQTKQTIFSSSNKKNVMFNQNVIQYNI